MKTALSIAGSDCSGGAGIQADLKTMTMNGVYAMSVITSLTAQNTTGISAIMDVYPHFLQQQLDMVFTDITPDAVKIGMLSNIELMEVVAERLLLYKAKNIVLDPVMVSTSGARLMNDNALSVFKEKLLPLANLLTPNIPEAEVLAEMEIKDEWDMIAAAKVISEAYQCSVLLKGGHGVNDANDLFVSNHQSLWFRAKRINNPNTHGTGCTLSSAIAANLAKGLDMSASVQLAKQYVSGALAANLNLGEGNGPLNHAYPLSNHLVLELDK